ncbi:MAG: EamA family transporter [Candidatus Cloacimonetes bacterium]|jgi:drug/metabolite transporter (DMT)-like permease|nr:EamA family transporter [Candidatus Cloacimonadota bacterium]MDD4156553.1 EamA family transporter [Candidatus Cloacimonadota bacterium]
MNKSGLYAFLALFLWGIHGPAGRYLAQNDVDMFFVFSARLWIGTLVFFIYLLIKKNNHIHWLDNWKKVLLISGIGIIANTILFHLTLIYLPGTLVMILENLSPIFVLFASVIWLKIKPTFTEILALLLSFSGIVLIVLGKGSFPDLSEGFYFGIFLGILTGLTFGAYIFFSADLVKPLKDEPIRIIRFLFKIFLISSILCTPFLFISKRLPSQSLQWFWLIEMGVFQSGLAYLFWNYALVHIKANTASILFLLTILFSTVNEIVFMNLQLNRYLISGGLLISVAGYWITTSLKRTKLKNQ